MSEFEIWFYRAIISALIISVFWIMQSRIIKQDALNSKFIEFLEKNEVAISRLNTILDHNERLCNEKHLNIHRRLENIEIKR